MSGREGTSVVLRASAVGTLIVGVLLLLGSWDGLYDTLDLPQAFPSLAAQLGGLAFVAVAYLFWSAAARPEVAPTVAAAGLIVEGGSAIVIAAWLIFRDKADLGIDTLGIVILIVTAVVLGVLALGLARVVFAGRVAGTAR
jgi:hypothetical protein